jgi:hypothetical protein
MAVAMQHNVGPLLCFTMGAHQATPLQQLVYTVTLSTLLTVLLTVLRHGMAAAHVSRRSNLIRRCWHYVAASAKAAEGAAADRALSSN